MATLSMNLFPFFIAYFIYIYFVKQMMVFLFQTKYLIF